MRQPLSKIKGVILWYVRREQRGTGVWPRGTVAEPRSWNVRRDEHFCALPFGARPGPVTQPTGLSVPRFPWPTAPARGPPASRAGHPLPAPSIPGRGRCRHQAPPPPCAARTPSAGAVPVEPPTTAGGALRGTWCSSRSVDEASEGGSGVGNLAAQVTQPGGGRAGARARSAGL